jgi:hypothetical protein
VNWVFGRKRETRTGLDARNRFHGARGLTCRKYCHGATGPPCTMERHHLE